MNVTLDGNSFSPDNNFAMGSGTIADIPIETRIAIESFLKSQVETTDSKNNGGTTDYYQIQPNWKQAQDIIEARNMNFSQGNILKAAFCFNTERHSGTNYERDLNKIIWFAQRELQRIKKS